MSSRHPKVETFATISAENAEYRRVFPILQAQAQQAMMMAAQEKGKYLHVLKLFASIVAQNMQKNIETVVLHKSVVDQPDTINIAREGWPSDAEPDNQLGYTYRVVSDAELAALNEGDGTDGGLDTDSANRDASPLLDSTGNPVEPNDSGPDIPAPSASLVEPA